MVNKEAADQLDIAADYIDRVGWCQGSMRNLDGQVCLMGAIRIGNQSLLTDNMVDTWDAENEMMQYIYGYDCNFVPNSLDSINASGI